MTTLSVLLKTAVEWEVIDQLLCRIRLAGSREHPEGRSAAACAADDSASEGPQGVPPLTRTVGAVSVRRILADTQHGQRFGAPRSTTSACDGQRCPPAAAHILFTPGDAKGTGASNSRSGGPRRSLNDGAVHASQSGGGRERDPVVGRPEARGNQRGNRITRDG